MPKTDEPSAEDVGAAMMAWYADAIEQFPDGLVTQAQAATMLGLSRVGVSRLVTRGYLRAVYFPRPPDIVGIAVGQDDPTWLKIAGWLGDCETYAFPKACYVAFEDVVDLWQSGEARKRCKRDWNEIRASLFSPKKRRLDNLREIHHDHQTEAERRRQLKSISKEK